MTGTKLTHRPKLFCVAHYGFCATSSIIQEAQLMLTTGSTRLAVSRGQQTWYHSTCYIIVSYCAIVTVFKTRRFYDIRLQKIS